MNLILITWILGGAHSFDFESEATNQQASLYEPDHSFNLNSDATDRQALEYEADRSFNFESEATNQQASVYEPEQICVKITKDHFYRLRI